MKTPAEEILDRLEMQDSVDPVFLDAAYKAVRAERRTPDQARMQLMIEKAAFTFPLRANLKVLRRSFMEYNRYRKNGRFAWLGPHDKTLRSIVQKWSETKKTLAELEETNLN